MVVGESRRWGRAVFRDILVLNIATSLVYSSSTENVAVLLTIIWLLCLALLAAAIFGPPDRGASIFWISFGTMTCLILWAGVQTLRWPVFTFYFSAPTATGSASDLVLRRDTISVSPADSLWAIPQLATPFVAFLTALMIARDDKDAVGLIRRLGVLGGILAILATLKFVLFRDVAFAGGSPSAGALTGVFVNHNTAATFFGMVMLILASICIGDLYLDGRDGGRRGFRGISLPFNCIGLAFSVFALLLARSRGGLASALVGLFVLAIILSLTANRSESVGPRSPLARVDWRILALFLLSLAGIALLGGRVARAMFEKGYNDPRFCTWPQMLQLLYDNLLFGTGLANFEATFSTYRSASCGIWGTWDKAHNLYIEGFIALGVAFPIVASIVLVMSISVLARGLARRRRLRRYVGLGVAACALCGVHSAFDFSMQIPGVSLYFAVLLGAIVPLSFGGGVCLTSIVESEQ
ncbi:O-antigen ligase family protein [Rhizobium sp.]|uniref:O-antigen ligase family protein n=1 Tax=Rhizobium sp. TaxID=391 RepID=UPI0028AA9B99